MLDTSLINEQTIILITPVVVILLFQLSSYLNQTILSTGLVEMEISDFAQLTGIPNEKIRRIAISEKELKFKVIAKDEKSVEAEVIFDPGTLKLKEEKGIKIEEEKLRELRRIKFSAAIKVSEDKIKISADGNTFTEIRKDSEGKEFIAGKVVFDEKDEPKEVTGTFKKYF